MKNYRKEGRYLVSGQALNEEEVWRQNGMDVLLMFVLYLVSSEMPCCHESGLTLPPTPNKFRDLIIWHENRSLTITKLHSKQEVKKWGNLFRRKYSCHLICWCSLSNCPTFISKSLKSSRLRSIRADIGRFSRECTVSSIFMFLKSSFMMFTDSFFSSFGIIVCRKRKFLLLWMNLSGTETYRSRSRSWENI